MPYMFGNHVIYTVRPGDTIYSIADQFNSDAQLIAEGNLLFPPFVEANTVYPGQVIVIPVFSGLPYVTLYVIQPGESLYALGQRFSADPQLMAGITEGIQHPGIVYPNQQVRIPALIYAVEANDSLYTITQRTGIPQEVIIAANQGRTAFSPDLLYEGYRLIIPLLPSTNIVVFDPAPGDRIQPNDLLRGYARVFEANVLYRLIDDNEVSVIDETFTTAEYGAPIFGPFETTLEFDREPTAQSGYLHVYTRSAKDGSIQDLVQVRIHFAE